MPGIAVIVTRMPRREAVEQLLRMVGSLCHESSYTTGTWIDECSGLYVGWAERRDSFCDEMPLRNEREDVTLLFSGEEFPEPGMAGSLRHQGHVFNPAGPSYLVHIYEQDPSFPAGLNGRFHGLLADRRQGRAVLFNDRYGMHRLYYHQSKEGFYFAAEAKAILAVRPELRRFDLQGVGEFIACGCTMENRTLFEGIRVLPPASAWVFRDGSLDRKVSYFHPKEWEEQEPLDPDSYYKELRQAFTRNLPRYFGGHQRVAMSLTGGLDTRMIMAWQKAEPGSLPCYTFGGMLRECQDVIVARKVARACGQPHQVLRLGREFLSQFPKYAERAVYLSDGCADVSHGVDAYLSEKEREIAPVRMTGNYGGEVLRRVRAFKPEEPLPGLFDAELLRYVHQAKSTYSNLRQGHPVTFAAFRQEPWHHYGVLAVEEKQILLRTPYLDNDIVRTAFRAPGSVLDSNLACLRLIADGNPALARIATDRGLATSGGLANAASRGLLEFLFKAEYGFDMGMPQWAARAEHLLAPFHFERLFLGRHKISHFRTWYRDVLAGYVRDTLLDRCSLSRPYIARKRLEAVVRDHLRGCRNYTTEIHQLLTLELLHRIFLNGAEVSVLQYHPGDALAARPAARYM